LNPFLRLDEAKVVPLNGGKHRHQWIGFDGKILTVNHGFSHKTMGVSGNISLKPIH
jgi:hypothetical protein